MSSYRGVVKDNVVVLPEGVHLDDGVVVEVLVPEIEGEHSDQAEAEERFKRRLVEMGLLREIRRPAPVTPPGDRTPIEVKGRPLSEEILRDRR